MKKTFIFLCIAIASSLSLSAEEGDMSVGANLNYGTEISSLGLGGKFQYGITDNIRGEFAFDYFFENSGLSMFNFDVTGHYLFEMKEGFRLYPLAGITFVNSHLDFGEFGSGNDTGLGFKFGGGAEYDITPEVTLNAELKYSLVNTYDQMIISIGSKYNF